MTKKTTDDFRQGIESARALPEALILKVGESFFGTIADMQVVSRDFGFGFQRIPVLILEEEDANDSFYSFWAFHKVERSLLSELKPGVGERIGIKRLEDGNSKKYGPYRRYTIKLDRPDTEDTTVNWDDFADEDEAEGTYEYDDE